MKISLNKNVIIKDYETKGLLIDVERADYRKVNSSGLTISKFLNKYGEISVEELLLKLSDLYELPEEVFGEEVQQFLDDMIEKGFFVKDGDYSRIETEETICHQTSNGIWIKVTNRCNLRCSYCYADSGEGEANELTIEEIENLLIELKPKNYNKIVITGGDPLMRKDIVEILKTCKKYGKVQILTNGTIGNAELYREIMEIVDAIQISLDSYEEIHHDKNRGKGSFVRAVNTVKTLTHINNKKVIVAMTPTPDYMPDIVEMIKFCLNMNVRQLHINRFVPYGRAKTFENKLNMEQFYKWVDRGYDFLRNIYINYYKQNKEFIFNIDVSNDLCNQVYSKGRKTSCGVNCNQISIDSNGNVYLCPSLHIEEFELGNIRTDNITEIMEKSKQKYGEIDVEMLSKCKNCEIKYYCGRGCRAIAFNETGDLYGQERNCDNYRNRVFDLMLQ